MFSGLEAEGPHHAKNTRCNGPRAVRAAMGSIRVQSRAGKMHELHPLAIEEWVAV